MTVEAALHLSSGRSSFPTWTSYVPAPKPTGRFPLALEAVGGSMIARHVFPGLTNVTAHARYFSFLAWVFWAFDQHVAPRVSRSKWPLAQVRYLVRLEHAFRCCTQSYALESTGARARGLIGVLKTPDLRQFSADAEVVLQGKAIKKIASAFEAQFYGSPFVALGLGLPDEDRIKVTGIGREAAEAFESALRDGMSPRERSALAALLVPQREVSVGQLQSLSARLRLKPVGPGEPENDVLRRVLFRLDPADRHPAPLDADDRERGLGLAWILDVVGQSKGMIAAPQDCHEVFACRVFKDGQVLQPRAPLDFTDNVWQRFEERQQQKIAVSAFWHEVLEYLENEHAPPRPGGAIVAQCLRLLERSDTLAEWVGVDAMACTVEDATGRVLQRTAEERRPPLTCGFELTEQIRDVRGEPDATARLGRALVSLLLAVGAWREAELPAEFRRLHERGGAGRLTLPWMADELKRRGGQTLSELVQWLVEFCILGQAIRVAYEKTDAAGRANRFFIERVDGGYRIVQPHPVSGRMPYDAARLEGAFGVLVSLGLLRKAAPDQPYALTKAGRGQLEAVIRTFA